MRNEVGSLGAERGEEEEEACRRERAKGVMEVFWPRTGLRVLNTDLDMLGNEKDVKKTERCPEYRKKEDMDERISEVHKRRVGCHYVRHVYVVTTDRLSNLFFGFTQANFIESVMESIRQCSNIACQKNDDSIDFANA